MEYPTISIEETGQRINAVRSEQGKSVKEIAEYLGISNVSVYKWFRGESLPTLDNLFALSVYFRLPMEALLIRRS
jgi:transcriptional regulator with XRE-family HTH domain